MFPIIPFMAGAAAGAAITYLVKDRETRGKIESGANKVADDLKDGVDRAKRAAKVLVKPSSAKDSAPDAESDASTSSD